MLDFQLFFSFFCLNFWYSEKQKHVQLFWYKKHLIFDILINNWVLFLLDKYKISKNTPFGMHGQYYLSVNF